MQKRKTRSIDTLHLIVAPTVGLKVCPECKKEFEWFGEQWVYRNIRHGEKRFYCSYKCWRAEDHRKEAKGKSLLRGGNYAGI